MKFVYLFILFLSQNSLAASAELKEEKNILSNLCQNPEPAVLNSIKVNDKAEFFFRTFPLSERLTYSANQKNYILDLKTGVSSEAPGQYDGFPSPDERFLITANGTQGIKFFDMKNLSSPILTDGAQTGYYQSCGVYKNSLGKSVYRVLIDDEGKGLSFKEYIADANSGLKAVQEKSTPLCRNLKSISLPMLSKDGKLLAAFDSATQSTNIYRVSSSGKCDRQQSLGVNAGKVDFSFDNKSVTYSQVAIASVEHLPEDRAIWMRSPKSDMVANIYVQNLKTGEAHALTHYTNSNALYPSFNAKGEIIARKFDKNGTEFLKLDPKSKSGRKNKEPVSTVSTCTTLPKSTLAALKLGAIFLKYCNENLASWMPESIVLLGKDLDSRQCKLLVGLWSKDASLKDLAFLEGPLSKTKLSINLLKEISVSHLSAACGK